MPFQSRFVVFQRSKYCQGYTAYVSRGRMCVDFINWVIEMIFQNIYCVNYFSIAVIKTAWSRQLIERRNYLELMERGVTIITVGKCGSRQAWWPEGSHSKPLAGSRVWTGNGMWLLKSQSQTPSDKTSSSKATPPKLIQIALPAGVQLFKYSMQWGDVSFKPSHR